MSKKSVNKATTETTVEAPKSKTKKSKKPEPELESIQEIKVVEDHKKRPDRKERLNNEREFMSQNINNMFSFFEDRFIKPIENDSNKENKKLINDYNKNKKTINSNIDNVKKFSENLKIGKQTRTYNTTKIKKYKVKEKFCKDMKIPEGDYSRPHITSIICKYIAEKNLRYIDVDQNGKNQHYFKLDPILKEHLVSYNIKTDGPLTAPAKLQKYLKDVYYQDSSED